MFIVSAVEIAHHEESGIVSPVDLAWDMELDAVFVDWLFAYPDLKSTDRSTTDEVAARSIQKDTSLTVYLTIEAMP